MIEELEKVLNEEMKKQKIEGEGKIIFSNRPELCDFQSDSAFALAKKYHKNPLEIANTITKSLLSREDANVYFEKIECVSPGFINITVCDAFINKWIRNMKEKEKFGIQKEKEETYIIDYGGYNVAKPLHIGHLRPTIIGEAIKRIIQYKGGHTIADVHLGDYGLQMGQVIYGIQRDKRENDITIDYLNQIYPCISALCKEEKEIKEKCTQITKELQEGNKEYNILLDKIVEVSVLDAKKICEYLGVTFDLWNGERDAYKYLKDCEKLLREKGLLEYSEGALVVNVKKEEEKRPMPPLMFKKSNGAYVYESTDIATIYERKQKYNPDHTIYVTDFRQNLHFEQVFRVSDLAGLLPYHTLEHAYNGTINGKDGKPFKTRKGDAPKLTELFSLVEETFLNLREENQNLTEEDRKKIVNAIIKFADLQNSREKDYSFDPEKFSNVVGKTGPYILYTYLRIEKIIKEVGKIGSLSDKIYNEIDRSLRLKLLKLERYVNLAYKERKPNYLADYIYNLALLANTFYQKNHMIGLEDDKQKEDWTYLLTLTNKVIKEMLYIIGIEVPSHM